MSSEESLCYDGFVIAVFFIRLIDIELCNQFEWAIYQTYRSPNPSFLINRPLEIIL
jgi:hypothetical protein